MQVNEKRKSRGAKKLAAVKAQVTHFLCRDENSRLLPGKKTQWQKKKRKFKEESYKNQWKSYIYSTIKNPKRNSHCHTESFVHLRPFYITEPKTSDRNTCAYIVHENIQMLVEKLFQSGFVKVASISELLSSIVCDPLRKDCMYRVCVKCCYKEVEIAPQEGIHKLCEKKKKKQNVERGRTYKEYWMKNLICLPNITTTEYTRLSSADKSRKPSVTQR